MGWAKTGNIKGPQGDAGASPSAGTLSVVKPATGATVTIADGVGNLIVSPTALIAALTIVLPANPPAWDRTVRIAFTQAITLLAINPNTGQTLATTVSLSVGATSPLSFVYDPTAKVWYRNAG